MTNIYSTVRSPNPVHAANGASASLRLPTAVRIAAKVPDCTNVSTDLLALMAYATCCGVTRRFTTPNGVAKTAGMIVLDDFTMLGHLLNLG